MSTVVDLVVKTVFHEDVRRFKLSRPSFVHLRDLISKTYEKLPSGYVIKYTDPEGDVCSIGSDAELEEAFNASGSTLKLDLIPTEVGGRAPTLDSLPKSLPQENTAESKASEVPQKEEEKAPQKEEEKASPQSEVAKDNETKEGSCDDDCSSLCGLILELVQDQDIQTNLAAIVQSLMSTVEKGEVNFKSLTANLFVAVPSLKESAAVQKILPILVKQTEKINAVLDQAKNYIPMVLPMLKEIPQMLPQLLDLIDLDDLKDHLKALFTNGFPHFPCENPFASDSDDTSGDEKAEGVIHENIKCDGCGVLPITGDRFKCTVCHDFDLCSACEQKDVHPSSHPLLKLKEAPRRDVHYGITCDGCGTQPIRGVRYKCLVCPNFDLCATCEAKNDHPSDHTLLKLKERKGGQGRGRFGFGPWHSMGFGGHGPRHFGHHGPHHFGHHGPQHFGHHGPQHGHHGHHGFGNGPHHGFGFGPFSFGHGHHGLKRLFKCFKKVVGLKGGRGKSECPKDKEKCHGWKAEKCRGWKSHCRRSESVQPKCNRSEDSQSKCKRSRSTGPQSPSKCHRRKFERHPKSEMNAKFIKDINFPENSVIAPGITLIKQWQVKNNGSTVWPEGSKLIFLRGNRELLGEQEEFSAPIAQPGQTVDVSCPITVPTKPGRYSAYFKLADKDRVVFGGRFWTEFTVAEEEKNIKTTAPPKTTETKKEIREDKAEDNSKIPQGIDSVIPPVPSAPTTTTTTETTTPVTETSKYASALGVLERMGFVNLQLNNSLLERAQGNMEQVVTWLLEMENSIPH